jgi:hypothetical protein
MIWRYQLPLPSAYCLRIFFAAHIQAFSRTLVSRQLCGVWSAESVSQGSSDSILHLAVRLGLDDLVH